MNGNYDDSEYVVKLEKIDIEYTCLHCNNSFSLESDYKEHLKNHQNEKLKPQSESETIARLKFEIQGLRKVNQQQEEKIKDLLDLNFDLQKKVRNYEKGLVPETFDNEVFTAPEPVSVFSDDGKHVIFTDYQIKIKSSTMREINNLKPSIKYDSTLVRLILYSVYPIEVLRLMTSSSKIQNTDDPRSPKRIDDNVKVLISDLFKWRLAQLNISVGIAEVRLKKIKQITKNIVHNSKNNAKKKENREKEKSTE